MAELIKNNELYKEIKAIRKDLDYIKKHMVDADTILTKDDEVALKQAEKDYKEGKTVKL